MKAVTVILGLLAGLILTPPVPASAQAGYPTQVAMLASLRSGDPQRVLETLETIKHDDPARTLYINLYQLAGSEPSSPMEASAIAKALGFVLIAGMDDELQTIAQTEFNDKLEKLTALLLQINPEVGGTVEQYQWRAVELMQYSSAYDYYRVVSGTSNEMMEQLLSAFATSATAQLTNPFVIKNNLSLKLAAASGYTAIMLRGRAASPHGTSPEDWLYVAMQNIETTIWQYQSDPAGEFGYSEGPWYFRYAMMNLLPFFLALDVHVDGGALEVKGQHYRSPLRDDRFHRLFEWIAALRMPDGMLPPFEDTYGNTYFPEMTLISSILPEFEHYAWNNFSHVRQPIEPSRLSSELARTFDGRVEYLMSIPVSEAAPERSPLVRLMPDAGYAVFRSGWESDAMYFAMIGKHGIARTHRSPVGSGHKHANEGAFLLHAGGELLVLEPGYHSSTERDALVFSNQHNVLLIDGKGPDSTSYGSNLFGVDAFITDTLSRKANGLAVLRTQYQDADIERRAAVLGGRYVILRDAVHSGFSRRITHQLHGNGNADAGSYATDFPKHCASWTSGAMTLHAMVNAPTSAIEHASVERLHAPSSRTFARHDALYSSVTADNACFHTVLYAAPTSDQITCSSQSSPDGTSIFHIRTGADQLVSLINTSNGSVALSLPDFGMVSTDALAFHCILDPAGRPESWMFDEGRSIRQNDEMLLSSSMPVRAVCEITPQLLHLTLRSASCGTVLLRVPYTVLSVQGNGLATWDMEGGMLRLTLDGTAADLDITLSSVATSVASMAETTGRPVLQTPYPHPFRSGSSQDLQVPFNVSAPTVVRIDLHDALGRVVAVQQMDVAAAGSHLLALRLRGVSAGTYLLRLQSAQGSDYRNIILR